MRNLVLARCGRGVYTVRHRRCAVSKLRIDIDKDEDRAVEVVIDEAQGKARVTVLREFGPDHTLEIDLRQPAKREEAA